MNDEYEKYWKRKYEPKKIGNAEIHVYEIDEEAAAFSYLRGGRDQGIPMGTYTRLLVNDDIMMSDTPFEYRSHIDFFMRACGEILINGLGLGCCLDYLLKTKSSVIDHITVIEKNENVIKLVSPYFDGDDRVIIIHADAFEYKPPKGKTYNVVWHDIWVDMCLDNLPQMTKLHRKYGRRCDWQDSWQKTYLQRIKRKNKRNNQIWR